MISPLEIQEKEFAKGLKGFKEDEVNEFLDQITLDLERLLEENRQLKAERDQLEEDLKKYQSSESAVLETLETAKALMGDISSSAEKRAQILLKNAELDAQLIQREAKESVERMNEESAIMKNRFSEFKKRYKQMLETELQRFDTLTAELFPEMETGMDMEDLNDLPEAKAQQERPKSSAADNKKTMVNIK